eukprot:1496826-Pyramimonas_sp.AAC.1
MSMRTELFVRVAALQKLGKHPANPVKPNGGRINLRGLIEEIDFLEHWLHGYRNNGGFESGGDDEDEGEGGTTTELPQAKPSGAAPMWQVDADLGQPETDVELQPETMVEPPEAEGEQPPVEGEVAAEGSTDAQ